MVSKVVSMRVPSTSVGLRRTRRCGLKSPFAPEKNPPIKYCPLLNSTILRTEPVNPNPPLVVSKVVSMRVPSTSVGLRRTRRCGLKSPFAPEKNPPTKYCPLLNSTILPTVPPVNPNPVALVSKVVSMVPSALRRTKCSGLKPSADVVKSPPTKYCPLLNSTMAYTPPFNPNLLNVPSTLSRSITLRTKPPVPINIL